MFVKICGLKTERDVDVAVEAGADAVGFVFSESPRLVDVRTAAALGSRVPEGVLTVGVYRNESLEYVRATAEASGIRAVQLHGDYAREDFAALGGGWTLVRAVAFGDAVPRCGELGEDMLLLDAPVPGSGEAWDWSRMPSQSGDRWLLAGGLTPGNVAEAVAATRPWGVDVSSGVESSRGVKDPALITAFVKAARSAE
ncbi:phosphoribosylanthranilate isomerase [Yinghuangia sp. YIM S09857]|uniref:phosphoribosylanthranilate isomerase n=1 Tax=Yinghuangia sp. YIM S09857 TaxID=3436929 RepID=UPI003F531446